MERQVTLSSSSGKVHPSSDRVSRTEIMLTYKVNLIILISDLCNADIADLSSKQEKYQRRDSPI